MEITDRYYLENYIQQAQTTHYTCGIGALASALSQYPADIEVEYEPKTQDELINYFNCVKSSPDLDKIYNYFYDCGLPVNYYRVYNNQLLSYSKIEKYFKDNSENTDDNLWNQYLPIMCSVKYPTGKSYYTSMCPQILNIIGCAKIDGVECLIVGDSFGNMFGQTFIDNDNEHGCYGGIYYIRYSTFSKFYSDTKLADRVYLLDDRFNLN